MNPVARKNRPFPWRRALLLIVVSAFIVRGFCRVPRRTWSLSDAAETSRVPTALDPAATYSQDIRRVILISIDTLRADHLGCYGYSRNTSPNLDALAAQGVRFNHALSPVPITLPAHCSMLTGTTPLHHQVHDNVGFQLSDSATTIAEMLQSNGFTTGAIIGAFPLDSQFGLSQGFDTYNDHIMARPGAAMERNAEEVTLLANTWLKTHRDDKFFLFLHYYDPHGFYQPHQEFRFTSWLPILSEKDKYDGEIAYTDYYVGRVMDNLRKLDLYDSTLIILVGDHGESLGEHGESTHMFFIYHSSIHVPLILKLPESSQAITVNDVVGIVDIVPTICQLLGIDPGPDLQGRDLSLYFDPAQPATSDRAVYTESFVPTKYNAQSLLALVTNRYKYIHTTQPELYDLLKDPRETDNVITDHPDAAGALHDRLIHLLATAGPADPAGRIQLDRASLERLQALGYVGDTITANFDFTDEKEDPKDLIDLHELWDTVHTAMAQQQYPQAQKRLRRLIDQRPDFYDPSLDVFARSFANHPDPKLRDADFAITLALHGAQATQYRNLENLKALTAVYVSSGRRDEARSIATLALKLQDEIETAPQDQPNAHRPHPDTD